MTTLANDLVSAWNAAGDAWLTWVCQRSVAGAVALGAVLAVLGAWRLLPRRLQSAHLPSHLLLLPLIVFVAPVERLLPDAVPGPLPRTAVFGDAATPPATRTAAAAPGSPATATIDRFADGGAVSVAVAPTPPRWPALGLALWCLTCGYGAASLWRRQRAAARALRQRAAIPSAPLTRRFRGLARAAGLAGDVRLRLVPGLASPLVCGVRRPTVYVPADLAAALPAPRLDFALRHELAHVRRRDVPTGAFAAAVRLAFWFHPAAWIASAQLMRWREFACDEAALADEAGRRSDVAATLLTLVERANVPRAPAAALLLSTRHFMKTRMFRILDPRCSARARMSRATSALLGALSLAALVAARPQGVASSLHDPVDLALSQAARWLVEHQAEDGSWVVGAELGAKDYRDHDVVSTTALAVRALLPALREEQLPVAKTLRRAVDFLESSQQQDGRFGPEKSMTMMYAHANALLALCAAQREWPDDVRKARIERGVRWAQWARNPYKGWRYQPRDGDNDSKITGTMLLALHAARALGVEVEPAALTGGGQLLDALTDPATGRTGFVKRGQTMSRFVNKVDAFPGEYSEEPTALRLLVERAAGLDVADRPTSAQGLALVAACQPEWSTGKGTIDLVYWQLGAEAMAAVGGDAAAPWRERLHAALLPHRVVDGDVAHWPAVDAWSYPGMETYATASAMLALRALR